MDGWITVIIGALCGIGLGIGCYFLYVKNEMSSLAVLMLVLFIIGGISLGVFIANDVDPGWFFDEEPCKNCNILVSIDVNYCPHCGHENVPVCDNCFERLDINDIYCSNCGTAVN